MVGVIAPWNYPWSIPFGEVAIALMAGNGVVLKPASLTPLIGAADPGGVRAGRAAPGPRADRARRRRRRPGARRVSGGQDLLHRIGRGRPRRREECARRMKGSVLELGGKDPKIVCADANLANAISGASGAASPTPARPARASSACTWWRRSPSASSRGGAGARRAHRGRPARLRAPRSGRWSRASSSSPWRELVDDAVAAGATLLCGGRPRRPSPPRRTHRRDATTCASCGGDLRPGDPDHDGGRRRTRRSTGERLGVRPRRLGVDHDRDKGERIADRLESGMVWVNDHMFSHGACSCSWGGVKDSGLGRSHSKFGFYECVNIKLMSWEPVADARLLVAPYDEALGKAMRASAKLLYGRDADKAGRAAQGRLPRADRAQGLRDMFKRWEQPARKL